MLGWASGGVYRLGMGRWVECEHGPQRGTREAKVLGSAGAGRNVNTDRSGVLGRLRYSGSAGAGRSVNADRSGVLGSRDTRGVWAGCNARAECERTRSIVRAQARSRAECERESYQSRRHLD